MATSLARELLTSSVVEQRANYRWEKEGQLIAQIVAGRKDLFTVLIEPHRAPLFRLIRSKLGNDFESDDVIQQTILKAFTRLGQFRFEASFRTWLIRIALNEVVQWHRKRLSTRLLILDHSVLAQLPIADQTASPLKLLTPEAPAHMGETVTAGNVSAKKRSTGLSDGSFEDFPQTDAPINRGNSGDALVARNGTTLFLPSRPEANE